MSEVNIPFVTDPDAYNGAGGRPGFLVMNNDLNYQSRTPVALKIIPMKTNPLGPPLNPTSRQPYPHDAPTQPVPNGDYLTRVDQTGKPPHYDNVEEPTLDRAPKKVSFEETPEVVPMATAPQKTPQPEVTPTKEEPEKEKEVVEQKEEEEKEEKEKEPEKQTKAAPAIVKEPDRDLEKDEEAREADRDRLLVIIAVFVVLFILALVALIALIIAYALKSTDADWKSKVETLKASVTPYRLSNNLCNNCWFSAVGNSDSPAPYINNYLYTIEDGSTFNTVRTIPVLSVVYLSGQPLKLSMYFGGKTVTYTLGDPTKDANTVFAVEVAAGTTMKLDFTEKIRKYTLLMLSTPERSQPVVQVVFGRVQGGSTVPSYTIRSIG